MNMFEKAKSHFRFYFFFVCVNELAFISLYFSVLINILFAFFFFSGSSILYFNRVFLNLKLKRFFAYVKHYRCCVVLLTQSPRLQQSGKSDLVSLVIVLCSFLSADLIIVQEVLLWRFNCCRS